MLIEWDDSYTIDSGIIDEQHKKLFDILNATFQCMKTGLSRECDQDAIVQELQKYADIHFNDEEAIMRREEFPLLEKHIREHDAFRRKVDEFTLETQSGHVERMLGMITFLDKWLIAHILNSDKKFAYFLREKAES